MQKANAPARQSKYMAKDFFTYTIPFVAALAPSGQTSGNFTLDADSDFLWQKFAAYAQVASDGTTVSNEILPGVTIIITDTASGRNLMNNPVPLASLSGSGRLPFILPTPKVFQARGTVQVQLSNITDGVTYSQIYLAFEGTKLFLRQ